MKFKDNWEIKIICGTGTVLFLIVLLITVAQAVCYWIPNWWEKEYSKWDTPNKVVGGMSLEDAVYVNDEMLEYCIGRRDSLSNVKAVVGGEKVKFFTKKELSHLADCRKIFSAVLKFRWIATIIMFAFFAISYYLARRKLLEKQYRVIFSRCYLFTTAGFVAMALLIALYGILDFNGLFIVFHLILFDNYDWLLDPAVDQLVNIMQPEVFSDFAILMAGIWFVVVGLISIPCFKNRK